MTLPISQYLSTRYVWADQLCSSLLIKIFALAFLISIPAVTEARTCNPIKPDGSSCISVVRTGQSQDPNLSNFTEIVFRNECASSIEVHLIRGNGTKAMLPMYGNSTDTASCITAQCNGFVSWSATCNLSSGNGGSTNNHSGSRSSSNTQTRKDQPSVVASLPSNITMPVDECHQQTSRFMSDCKGAWDIPNGALVPALTQMERGNINQYCENTYNLIDTACGRASRAAMMEGINKNLAMPVNRVAYLKQFFKVGAKPRQDNVQPKTERQTQAQTPEMSCAFDGAYQSPPAGCYRCSEAAGGKKFPGAGDYWCRH